MKRAGIGVVACALMILSGPVGAQNQPAETVRATHGDWQVRCSATRADDCFMVARGFDIDGTPVVEMSLVKFGPDRSAAAGATVIAPLGTALPEGVVLQVDTGERRRFAYDFCAPAGCVANLALTDELIAAMKGGARARITVAPAARPEQPKTVGVSLTGFTAAYADLPEGGS